MAFCQQGDAQLIWVMAAVLVAIGLIASLGAGGGQDQTKGNQTRGDQSKGDQVEP